MKEKVLDNNIKILDKNIRDISNEIQYAKAQLEILKNCQRLTENSLYRENISKDLPNDSTFSILSLSRYIHLNTQAFH